MRGMDEAYRVATSKKLTLLATTLNIAVTAARCGGTSTKRKFMIVRIRRYGVAFKSNRFAVLLVIGRLHYYVLLL
jgi:hypothetical protein